MFKNSRKLKLGEVCSFSTGDGRKSNGGSYPIYGGNGIMGYTDDSNNSNCIIIGRVGAYCGNVYYEKGKCWITDNAITLTSNEYIRFLYYLLKTLNLPARRIGTSQPLITQTILKNIDVILPDIEEQKAIADVLSSFDDKIELNNKIIKNLEDQAQSLYKQWFVDFEFPNEEGKPYKSSGGKFKDSELGLIPEEWRLSSIDDFVQVNKRGISPLYSERHDTPVINQKCIRDSLIDINEITFNDDSKMYSPEIELRFMDTLVNSMGVGTLGRISPYILKIKAVPHSCVTLIRNEYYPCFTYLTIKSLEERITQMGTGTTGQTSLNNKSLGALKILVPDKLILKKTEDSIINNYKEIALLVLENKKLEETRDYLLPKLMSGEIKVTDIK